MPASRAQRIRELFDQMIELPDSKRRELLDASCADDPSIAREVLELIAAIESRSTSLDVNPAAWFRRTSTSASVDVSGPSDAPADSEGDQGGLAGAVVGDFRIIRLLGRGGMSSVYEAEQLSLGRRIALKVLQTWFDRRDARRRFIEEASTLAQLKHPGIAQVIAAGSHEFPSKPEGSDPARLIGRDLPNVPWIAIELVEDARTILQAAQGKAEREVLSLFALVADAVHHGHRHGFIHRDLKPANILVNRDDTPKVIDFGIARVVGPASSPERTRAGELLGSPRYMSPEQIDPRHGQADTRSDVYALGVVLYEALTGHLPHGTSEDSLPALARAICEQTPRDPQFYRPDLSRDAALVCLKAISRSPGDRYQSASELAEDLRRIVRHEPVKAHPPSVTYSACMLMRRHPITTALAAAACVGLIVGIIGVAAGLSRERTARRATERAAWLANLTSADAAIRLGDGGAAIRRLRAIPQHQRGWEWNYLLARADTSTEYWDVPGAPVYATCSRSGRWIAAAYDPKCVRFFDARTHELVSEWPELAISGTIEWCDDESLAVVPTLDAASVIDLHTQTVVAQLPNHPARPSLAATFSHDHSLVAISGPLDAGLRVFNTATGRQLFSRPDDGWVYRAAFTPDGQLLLWCAGSTLHIIETATLGEVGAVPVERITKFEPGGVVVSPDGATAAVICGTDVQLIDIAGRSVRAELRGHAQRVHSVAFDASGTRIVSSSVDRTVRVWNASSGELMQTLLGHERPTIFAAFLSDPSGSHDRIIATNDRGRVRIWDLKRLGPVGEASHPLTSDYVREVIFTSNPDRLESSSRRSAAVLNLDASAEPKWQRSFDALDACILSGQGQLARLADQHTLTLESLRTGKPIWSVPVQIGDSIVASPSGEFILVAERADSLVLLRGRDGSRVGTLPGDPMGNQLPKFSPDSSRVLITSHSGRVLLCRVPECTIISELLPPGPHAPTGAFSTDGSLLAYAHARDGITIADARTLKPTLQIQDVGGDVWSVAFSPDNKRLAIGAQDRITHIYELQSGEELLQLRDHTGSVMSIAWSPDGRFLATGGYDKRVIVYDGMGQALSP